MRSIRRTVLATVLLFAAVALLAPRPAAAHALLSKSSPSNGERLEASPTDVLITLTEEPDLALSSFDVIDVDGTSFTQGDAALTDPLTVAIGVQDLPTGVYTVSWRVVSVVDGHLTSGTFAFGVGVDPSEAAAASVSGVAESPFIGTVGRWLFYFGVALLLGLATMTTIAGPPGVRRVLLVALGSAFLVLGLASIGLGQLSSAGVGIGDFLSSGTGRPLVLRAVGVVAVVALTLGQPSKLRAYFVLVAGLFLIGVHAGGGHAAAHAGIGPMAIQTAHFAAAAVWAGGLTALVVGWLDQGPEARAEAVKGFSRMAFWVFVLVGVTGALRAIEEVGSWGGLINDGYGRIVLAKIVAFGVLLALASVNRFRVLRKLEERIGQLRKLGAAEIAIAASVMILTGFLAQGVPSATTAAAAAENTLVVRGENFSGTLRAELTMRPGRPGVNSFSLKLTDADGDSLGDAAVRLIFSHMDSNLGGSELQLESEGDGVWTARSSNLALEGRWKISVLVQQATDSTEIPIEFEIDPPPDRIIVDRVPGQPTLYTVKISGGKSAQVYSDPEVPGFSQLHVTFFDPSGAELEVSQPTITATAPDGGELELIPRRFGPGHFVTDVDLVAGEWIVSASGDLPDTSTVEMTLPFTIDP